MRKNIENLQPTGRTSLKKLGLHKLTRRAEYENSCTYSQLRTIRRLVGRSNEKSHLIRSPYLQLSTNCRLLRNNMSETRQESMRNKSHQSTEKGKGIKVDVYYKGRTYTIYVYRKDSGEFVGEVQEEFIRALGHSFRNQSQLKRLIGFETINNQTELDYILSLDTVKINFNTIGLKPIISSRTSKTVSLRDFTFIKCLGSGGFSHVFLAKGKHDNRFYAVKLMEKKSIIDGNRESIVENERYIMEIARNPFLVELYYAFETQHYFAFVLEYCSGGELFHRLKYVRKMTEQQAKFYFVEILFGLQHLHQKHIVYRDIKPENLLIGIDGHVKIADFGLAKPNLQEKQPSYSFCGSPEYMAPQMLTRTGHTFTIDYYCIGALLYELVTGLPPYYSKNHEQIYSRIMSEDLTFPDTVVLSQQIRSLLKSLLQKNPKLRLGSYRGVSQIMIHPWIGKLNKEDIIAKKLQPPYIPDPYTFNFDRVDNEKQVSQTYNKVIQQQSNCKSFQPYFSDKFPYQHPNTITKSFSRRELSRSPLSSQTNRKLTPQKIKGIYNDILGKSSSRNKLQHTSSQRKL